MYFNIVQPLVLKKGDEASPSIISAGQALFVKMLITLELHGIFGSNFVFLCISTLSCHWYKKKDDEASPSIILAGRALLVKMLVNPEPHGIFGSNFVYLCFNIVQSLV